MYVKRSKTKGRTGNEAKTEQESSFSACQFWAGFFVVHVLVSNTDYTAVGSYVTKTEDVMAQSFGYE